MNRKLRVVVAAILFGLELGRAAAAEPDAEQLARIELLLAGNDVAGLRRYLASNPQLTHGEGELALLLRRFIAESSDIATFLHPPDLRDAVEAAAPREGDHLSSDPMPGGGGPDGEPLY